MAYTYEEVEENENSITTVTYSCEPEDMKYTTIGEDIKADFDFLIKDIPNILDETLRSVSQAANIDDAFYFENGAKVQNLMNLYEEIQADIAAEKTYLTKLHSAFMKDIDNINAELEDNFGHLLFYEVKEAGRTVENKES